MRRLHGVDTPRSTFFLPNARTTAVVVSLLVRSIFSTRNKERVNDSKRVPPTTTRENWRRMPIDTIYGRYRWRRPQLTHRAQGISGGTLRRRAAPSSAPSPPPRTPWAAGERQPEQRSRLSGVLSSIASTAGPSSDSPHQSYGNGQAGRQVPSRAGNTFSREPGLPMCSKSNAQYSLRRWLIGNQGTTPGTPIMRNFLSSSPSWIVRFSNFNFGVRRHGPTAMVKAEIRNIQQHHFATEDHAPKLLHVDTIPARRRGTAWCLLPQKPPGRLWPILPQPC